MKGIEPLDLPKVFLERAEKVAKPWEKYDLMLQYRYHSLSAFMLVTDAHVFCHKEYDTCRRTREDLRGGALATSAAGVKAKDAEAPRNCFRAIAILVIKLNLSMQHGLLTFLHCIVNYLSNSTALSTSSQKLADLRFFV